jgi:hypothetical protein
MPWTTARSPLSRQWGNPNVDVQSTRTRLQSEAPERIHLDTVVIQKRGRKWVSRIENIITGISATIFLHYLLKSKATNHDIHYRIA